MPRRSTRFETPKGIEECLAGGKNGAAVRAKGYGPLLVVAKLHGRTERTGTVQQVSATRSELLARKSQIRLASQGRDLLKERRSALVREFNHLGASALESLDLLDRDAAEAGRFLGITVAANGLEPVESAAVAAQGEVRVSLSTRNVAGVAIVEIAKETVARARTDRGYSLAGTTARIDTVAERFEAVLDRLLAVAALELSVRRLAQEVAQTTRRMNALEHVVLPRLEGERARIALVLEEREMEDRVRLRRMRSKRAPAGIGR
jgi:V/A-type H+-transporting ATPase subunit D